ncbi:FMN-binding negative transcriptional regulator [Tabrizicola sp. J26]|uniref:FMN-binding negative transcriptional regulator n=1 Tax=Alitabrizicola rongguiensis TaxID=2909234 RepID=UPI001F2257D8|nr:FMN-binding negative transcriptional regulator [Tabrizicola rongguiensis]MCF1708337.1 FMN-binding negative transcriptional regulator [Tabrizicola rongguiensis]
MHPNPAFRKSGTERNLDFARRRGFGILTINGADGPLAAHVPFLVAEDGQSLSLHLARSNPIARADLPAAALLAVSGPDSYVSPDWYGLEDQVPTWNYVAVHLRGRLEPLDAEALRGQVDDLSARFEAGLLPKRPWTSAKMSEGTMERMMRMILPFRMLIDKVDGTWKLNQNKPEAARHAAAAAIAELAGQSPLDELAALMREVQPDVG